MRFSNLNDDVLMREAGQARFSAFEELVYRHQQRVHNFLYRMCGHAATAGRLFEESWAELYRLRGSTAASGQPVVALFAIAARKAALDAATATPPHFVAADGDPSSLAWRAARLQGALLELPFKERASLLLCHFDSLKPAEAGACISEGEEHVRMLAGEGLKRLRERLGAGFFSQGLDS